MQNQFANGNPTNLLPGPPERATTVGFPEKPQQSGVQSNLRYNPFHGRTATESLIPIIILDYTSSKGEKPRSPLPYLIPTALYSAWNVPTIRAHIYR